MKYSSDRLTVPLVSTTEYCGEIDAASAEIDIDMRAQTCTTDNLNIVGM